MKPFSHTLEEDIKEDLEELNFLAKPVGVMIPKRVHVESWPEQKRTLKWQIREQYAIQATLKVMTNWQSPSYLHSMVSESGTKEGQIVGNVSDYTRDRHSEALAYEQTFIKQILGHLGILPIESFLTQSGMAGLSTILLFLMRKNVINRPMLVGKRSYFQNQEIIRSIKLVPIIEFDELDVETLIQLIETHHPSVIWIDSLTNHQEVITPNLKLLLAEVAKVSREEVYVVIDNSGLGPRFSVKQSLPKRLGFLRVVGFESLNKFYQFGMDRTTAGIIWGLPKDGVELFYSRLHAGTNITDLSALMLPTPDRRLLLKRMARMERNAALLVQALQPMKVWYPGVGAILTVELKRRLWSKVQLKQLVKRVVRIAQKMKISINAGTSFGLDTTRIYAVAMDTHYSQPFLRIAVGSEDCEQINKVALVVKKAYGTNS